MGGRLFDVCCRCFTVRLVVDDVGCPPGSSFVCSLGGVRLFVSPAAFRLVVFCVMASWVYLFCSSDAASGVLSVLVDGALRRPGLRVVLAVVLLSVAGVPALFAGSLRSAVVAVAVPVVLLGFGSVSWVSYVAGWGRGFLLALGVLVSLLAHEFGHVLVGRRCGVVASGVVVTGFGAGAVFVSDEFPSASAMFLTTVAGPVVSLVSAGVLVGVPGLFGGVPGWWGLVGWVGVLVAGVNVVPVLPLDGGWMVSACVWWWHPLGSHQVAERVWRRVGPWVLGVLALLSGVWGVVGGVGWLSGVFWSLVSLIPLLFVTQRRVRALAARPA